MDENNCWVKHHREQGCWIVGISDMNWALAERPPFSLGEGRKNPTSWASIFCSSAGEWEEEKSHFLKGLLCQKCLEYPAKLHLHTLLHIHALCTYYSTIVHCFGGFLKTCTQWWSFHLNFLWSWIPFSVGKKVMMLTKCSAMPVPDSGVLWGF